MSIIEEITLDKGNIHRLQPGNIGCLSKPAGLYNFVTKDKAKL